MDLSTWTWAISTMLGALADVFNKALSLLGAALPTITILIFLTIAVRLIVAPIIGSARFHMLDTAMYGTSREIQREKTRANFRAARQADRDMLERALSKKRK